MSETLGAISYDGHKQNRFLDVPFGPERGNYAEETAQQIDAEVKRIMTDAHALARTVLSERREALDLVAHRLLEKEVIEGDELREIMRPHGAGGPDGAPEAAVLPQPESPEPAR